MKAIARRLRRLEERLRPALRAIARYDPSATDRLRGALAAHGFVPGPLESLAEVCARAMGITCPELRARLGRRAAGLPFEELPISSDIIPKL
jgi:hypothetical protein